MFVLSRAPLSPEFNKQQPSLTHFPTSLRSCSRENEPGRRKTIQKRGINITSLRHVKCYLCAVALSKGLTAKERKATETFSGALVSVSWVGALKKKKSSLNVLYL